MRELLVSLFLLSRPTNAGDVLKFAFHVSNLSRVDAMCPNSLCSVPRYLACVWGTFSNFYAICV